MKDETSPSAPSRERQLTGITDGSSARSFVDAISDSGEIFNHSNNSDGAEQARKRQIETTKLLSEHESDDCDEQLVTNVVAKTVSSWVKNATNFISIESSANRASRSMKNKRTYKSFNNNSNPNTTNANTSSSFPSNNNNHIGNTAVTINRQETLTKIVDTTDSICSYPNCIQSLNIAVSRFHCRKCNGWYCVAHAGHPSFGMKLVPSTGEPSTLTGEEKGVWSRICQRCFIEKFYHNFDNHPQAARNLMEIYSKKRSIAQEENREQFQRLEARLKRLADYDISSRMPFRMYEKKIVKWEEDSVARECRGCGIEFNPILRKHHCRLCGKIYCGESSCLLLLPLKLTNGKGIMDVRTCTRCDYLVFKKAIISETLVSDPSATDTVLHLFNQMKQLKAQILDIMPRFNEQLLRFEAELDRFDPDEDRLVSTRHEAAAARDTLILLFKHYEFIAKKCSSYHTKKREERMVLDNIQRSAVTYLQANMFTLQMLPKLDLRRLQRPKEEPSRSQISNQISSRASSIMAPSISNLNLKSIKGFFGGISQILSPTRSPSSPSLPTPANTTALEEKYNVLWEQRGQLEKFLTDAVRDNKTDELNSLQSNLNEVNREIVAIQKIFNRYGIND